MAWTTIEEKWDKFSAEAQNRWGRLTDEDLATARSGRNELVKCVLHRCGIAREVAERHVDAWINSYG